MPLDEAPHHQEEETPFHAEVDSGHQYENVETDAFAVEGDLDSTEHFLSHPAQPPAGEPPSQTQEVHPAGPIEIEEDEFEELITSKTEPAPHASTADSHTDFTSQYLTSADQDDHDDLDDLILGSPERAPEEPSDDLREQRLNPADDDMHQQQQQEHFHEDLQQQRQQYSQEESQEQVYTQHHEQPDSSATSFSSNPLASSKIQAYDFEGGGSSQQVAQYYGELDTQHAVFQPEATIASSSAMSYSIPDVQVAAFSTGHWEGSQEDASVIDYFGLSTQPSQEQQGRSRSLTPSGSSKGLGISPSGMPGVSQRGLYTPHGSQDNFDFNEHQFCTKCGRKNELDANFCAKCGGRLTAKASSGQPAADFEQHRAYSQPPYQARGITEQEGSYHSKSQPDHHTRRGIFSVGTESADGSQVWALLCFIFCVAEGAHAPKFEIAIISPLP